MKIQPHIWATPVREATEPRPPEVLPKPAGPGATVSVSEDGKWVAGVKDAARETPAVRADVVERTRAAIADGTFERSIDMDLVVDRLLGDG